MYHEHFELGIGSCFICMTVWYGIKGGMDGNNGAVSKRTPRERPQEITTTTGIDNSRHRKAIDSTDIFFCT